MHTMLDKWPDLVKGIPPRRAFERLAQIQIAAFFKGTHITQEDCNQWAARLIRTDQVHPTATQGSTSYTVTAHGCATVVQFRASKHPLDVELTRLARQTYGAFVPKCELHDLQCTRPGHTDVLNA